MKKMRAKVDIVIIPFPAGQRDRYALAVVIDRVEAFPVLLDLTRDQAEYGARKLSGILYALEQQPFSESAR